YILYLDHGIRTQFEGKRWAIPAHVYANPVELYAGHTISAAKFEGLLQQLHYRKDAKLAFDGSYFHTGNQFLVRTRDFTFWDSQQQGLLMRVMFGDAGIIAITDVKKAEDIPLVRMDPVQIGSFYPKIKEDRVLIKLNDAPDALIKGLLASEDREFYQHFGLSMRGIVRAIWSNVKAGGMVQGGSTITQQLAKNFLFKL
ncbi:transglycosylase domain-containing protein, partial [Methylocucumis oryzae]|uniref:transglycosylase domain-containing protein n=1 Tax=Methylocucumis oryzae TaxID=1632867 RepID=UPI000AECE949